MYFPLTLTLSLLALFFYLLSFPLPLPPPRLYPHIQQEFYFKCANHRTEETEDCVALYMVRANTIDVECASCLDVG